jgi:hypothetical protein
LQLSHVWLEFPLKEAKALDEIISYLTRKHGGNVHETGIVTTTSKSIVSDPSFALRNVTDLTSGSCFFSKNAPGQLICWDFHEMRIRRTHYTIISDFLKPWGVEGSLDRQVWTTIDRKTDIKDFKSMLGQTARLLFRTRLNAVSSG